MPSERADPRAFAQRAHGSQSYGTGPYVVHLDEVAALVEDDPTLQAVAYLHDVLEDTAVQPTQLSEAFGDTVTRAVALVTDPPGANRRERKRRLHAQLAAADPTHPADRAALVVKAADRLANVRACVRDSDTRLGMYRAEHAAFRPATYRAGLCDSVWDELDTLLAEPSTGT